jgi:Acyl-protein synthetase, LuxE
LKDKFEIFDIQSATDFEQKALEIFRYQYHNLAIYNEYCQLLNIKTNTVNALEQIPFLPIEFFKTHKISDHQTPNPCLFNSSGTGNMQSATHYIGDVAIYQQSIKKAFEQFIGPAEEFVFLGLLPSYLEKKNSSLIYMVNYLMQLSHKSQNAYYLYNHQALNQVLEQLELQQQKYILFGVSFALLDFIDACPKLKLKHGLVIETGGMKGRKAEITKDVLLKQLQEAFATPHIYSEYSMCELQSQAYSLGRNIYQCPPWMQVFIRDLEDPLAQLPDGKLGAINIIDLANIHSCAFIATQDLGRKNGHQFEVLGRVDHSDIRGCSLLVV